MASTKTVHAQAHTTEIVSVSSRTSSSGASAAVFAAFAAWVTVWRTATEEHATELQRAMEAAAAWRSRFEQHGAESKAGKQGKDASAKTPNNSAGASQANHMADLQSALQAASACAADTADSTQDTATKMQDDSEHMAELQRALDAAAAWRSKLQGPKSFVREQQDSDVASTTASAPESSNDNDEEEDPRSCWVHATFLGQVNQLLSEGLRSGKRPARLFAGPWGRTGLGRRGEEVLVYIDVARARALGAELRFSRNGLVLARGSVIPASCMRKMVRIAKAELFYERQVEHSDAPKAVSSQKKQCRLAPKDKRQQAVKGSAASPLAAWLQSIA